MSWLAGWYLWLKAFHVIAVIAWMAGMFYLPRLYLYHVRAEPGSAQSETFKVMERRLLRVIINPAMVVAWAFGILLLLVPGIVDWGQGWVWVKLVLVLAMTTLHGFLAGWRRLFANDANRHGERFYRIVNEIPTLLVIAIVVMVVVKPF